ncbi:MAG: rod shape-determining protein MreC [Candidatus Cyclobacteriaceae bacterium M2_1C_046]
MQQLFLLIYQYRAALVFVLFEILCAWLIVQNNFYQRATFLNSSNAVTGNILQASDNVYDYFSLNKVNRQLAEENAQLRQQLQQSLNMLPLADTLPEMKIDTLPLESATDTLQYVDSLMQYEYLMAEVVSNTVRNIKNYITVNKGSKEGIETGMGVVGPKGVVGSVKAVSENFSVINSLLHSSMSISAKIKRTNDLGSVQWRGGDFTTASLLYIPRHVLLQPGDTVVTSGYNAVFPPGVPIGIIEEIEQSDGSFYNITVDLAVDFNELSYVYIISNMLKPEIDSLQKEAIEWLPQQ